MKKLAAFALAFCLALPMMAVPVFAIDYGTPPTEEAVADKTTGVGESADKPASIITPAFIETIENNSTIYVSESASVSKDVLSELVDSGKTVNFVTAGLNLSIAPADITAPKDIPLGMSVSKEDAGIKIQPAAKGDFGLTMTVTSNASDLGLDVTKPIILYYVDDNGVTHDYGNCTVTDGNVSFKMSHASYYILSNTVIPEAVKDSSNDVIVTGTEREAAESKKAVKTENDKGTEVKVTKDESSSSDSKVKKIEKSGSTITTPQLSGISIGAVVAVAALAAAKKKKK